MLMIHQSFANSMNKKTEINLKVILWFQRFQSIHSTNPTQKHMKMKKDFPKLKFEPLGAVKKH